MTSRRSGRLGWAVAITLVLALSACAQGGGQAGDQGGDQGGDAGDVTSSASPDSGLPSVEMSSPSPTPTVEPATGPWVTTDYMRMRLPQKWEVTPGVFGNFAQGSSNRGDGTILLTTHRVKARSLDAAARSARNYWARLDSIPNLRRVEDVVVGGETVMFHLQGHDRHNTADIYGVLMHGHRFVIYFTLWDGLSDERRRELIDSMLATWEIKVRN